MSVDITRAVYIIIVVNVLIRGYQLITRLISYRPAYQARASITVRKA